MIYIINRIKDQSEYINQNIQDVKCINSWNYDYWRKICHNEFHRCLIIRETIWIILLIGLYHKNARFGIQCAKNTSLNGT
jgi:hypothetical protein